MGENLDANQSRVPRGPIQKGDAGLTADYLRRRYSQLGMAEAPQEPPESQHQGEDVDDTRRLLLKLGIGAGAIVAGGLALKVASDIGIEQGRSRRELKKARDEVERQRFVVRDRARARQEKLKGFRDEVVQLTRRVGQILPAPPVPFPSNSRYDGMRSAENRIQSAFADLRRVFTDPIIKSLDEGINPTFVPEGLSQAEYEEKDRILGGQEERISLVLAPLREAVRMWSTELRRVFGALESYHEQAATSLGDLRRVKGVSREFLRESQRRLRELGDTIGEVRIMLRRGNYRKQALVAALEDVVEAFNHLRALSQQSR